MSTDFFADSIGLGFTDYNPKEKDVNSMTQTVFYSAEFMRRQQFRLENEFEKECLNQMARTNLSKYANTVDGALEPSNKYRVCVKIGFGYTYSKYNTLMHFLNVIQSYWKNPDLSNISLFGKDIYWYGILFAAGFLAATIHWSLAMKRLGHPVTFGSDLGFWIIVGGVLGARLLYVAANPADYLENPLRIFRIDQGGLVFNPINRPHFLAATQSGLPTRRSSRARETISIVVVCIPIGNDRYRRPTCGFSARTAAPPAGRDASRPIRRSNRWS